MIQNTRRRARLLASSLILMIALIAGLGLAEHQTDDWLVPLVVAGR